MTKKTSTKAKPKKIASKPKKQQEEPIDTVETEEFDQTTNPDVVEEKPKNKEPKKVFLKQWMVFAEDNKTQKRFRTFLLASCGAKAREFFIAARPKATILNVMCTAESTKEKSWLETNSPIQWEEKESRL